MHKRRSAPTLRELRGERLLTEVSEATGFSVGHISNVERGVGGVGKRLRLALAKHYRVQPEDIDRSCARTLRRAAAA